MPPQQTNPPSLRVIDGGAAPSAPLAAFRGRHAGQSVVVCGCGESVRLLGPPGRFVTIGVNDIGRLFHPDYLVVLNTPAEFAAGRFAHVQQTRAKAVFTHLDLPLPGCTVVRFRLGRRGGTDVGGADTLPYTRNSPYVAVCLALLMGARRIGLIGVDFTPNHFFAATGTHPLARELAAIDREYGALADACRRMGVELVNLSPTSRLTSLPRQSVEDFAAAPPVLVAAPGLKIVSYATTPVAGVPPVLARCIAHGTGHGARTVWATASYGNGVAFTGDVEWTRNPEAARRHLAEADAVILHNGRIDPQHRPLLAGKGLVTLAHNYMWNVDPAMVTAGYPGLVVAQYQGTLPEFAGWTPVPNPVPLWEEDYSPGPKGPRITIAYTPSGKHERYPEGHRLYWHGKGYATTLRVLDALARRYDLDLQVIRDGQVSHAQALAMKRRAHIVIDECVTGSYHRNSLEGLAAGCVVVNGVGIRPAIADLFRRCAGAEGPLPFERAGLDDLETVLTGLIERGAAALEEQGRANRRWMERHWDFTTQWNDVWLPAVERGMAHARPAAGPRLRPPGAPTVPPRPTPAAAPPAPPPVPADTRPAGCTVIVPIGGAERVGLLKTTLERLKSCRGVTRTVVVEMGPQEHLSGIAPALADVHVFIPAPEFIKTRAMNAGTAFADTSHLLWLDGDILVPDGLIEEAVAECRRLNLDCLLPWAEVRYLSEEDSAAVAAGRAVPDGCTPTRVFRSRKGDIGSAILARTAFVQRYGGMIGGFRGWGGEDNAWYAKARLLGRSAVTGTSRVLHHLYHPLSGGTAANGEHTTANPRYAANVALMNAVVACRTAAEFLARFPPPTHPPAPWGGRRRVACPPGTEDIGAALAALYGAAAVTLCPPGEPADITLAPAPGASPLDAARDAALRLGRQADRAGSAPLPAVPAAAVAHGAHATYPEFAAVTRGRRLTAERGWELPFALWQSRLGPCSRVLDLSASAAETAGALAALHPHSAYRHLPLAGDPVTLLDGIPDASAEQVFSLGTDPAPALEEVARILRPGGRLAVTLTLPRGDAAARAAALAAAAQAAGLEPPPALDTLPPDRGTVTIGLVFRRPGAEAAVRRVALALTGTADPVALAALVDEAHTLERLGRRVVAVAVPGGTPAIPGLEDRVFPLPAGTADEALAVARKAKADVLFVADSTLPVPPMAVETLLRRLDGGSGRAAGVTLPAAALGALGVAPAPWPLSPASAPAAVGEDTAHCRFTLFRLSALRTGRGAPARLAETAEPLRVLRGVHVPSA